MSKRIPISDVIHTRTLEADDDITELAQSIRDTGLKFPILVDWKFRLIDGLRRLKAMELLGHTTIEVEDRLTYADACLHIERTREHGLLSLPVAESPLRAHQIKLAIKPLMDGYLSGQRGGYKTPRSKNPVIEEAGGGDKLLARALGVKYAWMGATHRFFNILATPDLAGYPEEKIRSIEEMVLSGEISPYTAMDWLQQRYHPKMLGPVVDPKPQRAALKAAIPLVRGVLRGLQEFGPFHADITKAELRDLRNVMLELRRMNNLFIRSIEKELNER